MLLKYLKPDAIKGDDDYIRQVFTRGDTTDVSVQIRTLKHFGLSARFVTNFNNEKLKSRIDSGFPVPCGILHKGRAGAPSGGGHWIVVIGYDEKGWICHDPWGTLRHSDGSYSTSGGDAVHYSYELMDSRWTVDSSSDGWSILIDNFTPPKQQEQEEGKQMSINLFKNFFKYYNAEPHQVEAIELLFESLPEELKDENHPWVRKYRGLKEEAKQPVKSPDMVTKADLAYIWGCSESLIEDREIDELNSCLFTFDITTPERIRHFLSQTAHESGGGRWMKELSDGWYLEGRKDIGNTQKGDGPKYKGAGYLQLTGRANYMMLASYVNDPKVMEGVDYVSSKYPFTSAGAWWETNYMNDLIDKGAGVREVTRRVNGGFNGLSDREHYYRRCLKVI